MASSFDGVPFVLTLPIHGAIAQVPKWPDRHYPAAPRMGSVETTIQGRLALQEIDVKWRPVTLIFSPDNLPAAFITQAMLDAFVAAWTAGGIHDLILEVRNYSTGVIEALPTKKVIFDWNYNPPIELDEVSPTDAAGVPGDRLYTGTIHLRELIP